VRNVRVAILFAAAAWVAACTASPALRQEQTSQGPTIWTADFMRTKPGQQERYLRYLDANWARARRTVLDQGKIRSFRVLVVEQADSAAWDVLLLTEYTDSSARAHAEEIFRPVLDAQKETLIDGLSGRGPDNALKRTVSSTVLKTTTIQGAIER
jgi:hypothetical protein